MTIPSPDTLPREQRLPALLQAGVWLVFLISPVLAIFSGGHSPWITALSLASLVLFSVLYLGSFVYQRPLASQPRWVNTVAYSVVLLGIAALIWTGAGYTTLTIAPYLAATWLFKHELRTGFIATGLIVFVLALLTVLVVPLHARLPMSGSLTVAIVMVSGVRFAVEKEDQARELDIQLAQARQREGFARDVHDVLGHSLTVIAVKTELATKLLDRNPERARQELDEVLTLTRQSLAEVRSTVTSLRAPDLATQIHAAESACEAAGIALSVPRPEVVDSIPESQRELFAWCLREGVTNVVRHAGARNCTVTIRPGLLDVSDDGTGLIGPEGNGIRGIRERCESAGATLEVLSAGSGRRGTHVRVKA